MKSKRAALIVLLSLTAFAAAWPAAAQTTFVSDAFTVGANTMLDVHAPNVGGAWTRLIGAGGIIINAAADNARNVNAGDRNIYTNATPSPAAEDVVGITVTFTTANANNFIELFGRGATAPLNGYSARLTAGGNLSLIRYNGGVPTTLATAIVAVTPNTAISIVLSLKNASKQIWINGVVTAATSADNTLAATGVVGLGMNSNNPGETIADNFFASTFAPTAVDRLDATATRDATQTLIEWSTAREVQNLGFRVYRDDGKGRVLVSRSLIAGAAFMVAGASLPAGNTYRWIDADPRSRSARAWWIEEVDLHGRIAWHGPIVPSNGRVDSRVARSPSFVDLRQRDGVVLRTRLRPASLAAAPVGDRRRATNEFAGPCEKQRRLAASNAIKIGVDTDGLYRVTRGELVAGGLDAATDLQSLRMYADGTEEPLAIDGDAILFYGRALDTPSTATRIYWLTAGEGAGIRMATAPVTDAPISGRRVFMATAERRDKLFFLTFFRNADGDSFVGPVVSTDSSMPTTQALQLRHIDRASTDATLAVEVQGASDAGSSSDHRVAISLNGQHVGDMAFSGMDRPLSHFDIPAGLLAEGDNTVSLIAQNGDADVSAVVSVAITYAHTFVADDDRLLAVVDGGAETSIAGFTTNDVQIVDITDERAPIRITPLRVDAGTATFTAPATGPRTIVAIASSRLAHAVSIVRNEPAALHAAAGADVVIISHPSFVSALAPLVQLRQSQGLSAMVVKTDDVYDEYNYGAKDPEAIRTFLRDATHWQKPPRYVLLVGDASFDARNYLGFGDFDFVPTKLVVADLLETASDSWFTDFDDDGAPDIPIGRLSVRTLDDAAIEVGKIVTYETSALPPSRKIMVVSDADASIDFHANGLTLEKSIPTGFEIVDINAAVSGGVAARAQLLAGFSDALLINYIGHGSVEIWSSAGFFSRYDVAGLTRSDRAPIVLAMTCLNGFFNDVYTDSLAETLVRSPNGAVAVWASSALTSPEAQLPVNEVLMRALLAPGDVRLGDAVVAAQKSSYTPDIRKTFMLFGDPAMRVRTAQ